MASPQADGCYPRVNAGMVSTGQFTGMLVSIVGRVQSGGSAEQATLQSSDQNSITLSTVDMEGGLFQHDPEMVVEIIGAVQDESTITAFVCRNLSTDMDLTIYNQMITVQQSPAFAQYFQSAQPAM